MTITEKRRLALLIGNAFWMAGIALQVGGHPEWCWVPICWGGFALGYRYALTQS